MKLSLLFTTLLSGAAIASPLVEFEKRADYTTVIADVKVITAGLKTLNNSINAFMGGGIDLAGALKIMSDTTALENDLKKTISDTKASPKFKGHSLAIAIKVSNLETPIFSVLHNIIVSKPKFDTAILGIGSISNQVLTSLKQQKALSDQLGAAIAAKLEPSLASAAPVIQKMIDNHFNAAIKAYSKGGGIIPIPPLPTLKARADHE